MGQRNAPRYPRTARLNELVREIVAETVERLDDERLELVAITQVVVDRDMEKAVVYYDSLRGAEADDEVEAAFGQHRARLQSAIGRQARLRRTPHLQFEADDVERGAGRIEDILRGLQDPSGDGSDA